MATVVSLITLFLLSAELYKKPWELEASSSKLLQKFMMLLTMQFGPPHSNDTSVSERVSPRNQWIEIYFVHGYYCTFIASVAALVLACNVETRIYHYSETVTISTQQCKQLLTAIDSVLYCSWFKYCGIWDVIALYDLSLSSNRLLSETNNSYSCLISGHPIYALHQHLYFRFRFCHNAELALWYRNWVNTIHRVCYFALLHLVDAHFTNWQVKQISRVVRW